MVYTWLRGNFIVAKLCKLVFIFLQLQSICCRETTVNTSEIEYHDFENCTLRPASEKTVLQLEKIISEDNRFIILDITIEWRNSTPYDTYLSTKEWFMTTSVSGQHLLLLPDHFSEMSLGTLSYGIAKLHVTLKQEPEDCLTNLTLDDAEHILKYVLLTLPNNPETRNEDGISKLHICNGSRYSSDRSDCCALTLQQNNIICKKLKQDKWGSTIKCMFVIITVMFLLQSVSFIPKDMYEKGKMETFTLSDTTAKMQIKVTDNIPSTEECWEEKPLTADDILSNFCKKLNDHIHQTASGETFTLSFKVNSITSTVDMKQLHSELFPSSGTLKFLYVSLRDLFLLRKKSGCCCSYWNFLWFRLEKLAVFLTVILLLVPFIPRVLFLSKYSSDTSFSLYIIQLLCLILIGLHIPLVLLFVRIKLLNINVNLKELFQKSLRVTFETEYITNNKYQGHPISFFIRAIIYIKSRLRLLQFALLVVTGIVRSKSTWYASCIFLLTWGFGLYALFDIAVDCVLFYVFCFFCTVLGLLLNYNKVFQYVLLLLIVVKNAYDSISNVENKIRKLTIRVFKISRDLCADADSTILLQRNDESGKLSRFALCKCGSLCWLPRGVIVFNKLIKPENVYCKHLSKKFIEYVSCLPGHLTPGSKFSLLFMSFKEIASLIFILCLVLLLVAEFGNDNDLPSSVLTVITFVTGSVASIAATFWFKDTKYVADDDVHLNNLIKDHLADYEEPWMINGFDFEIMTCKRNSEQSTKETDISMVVERRDEQIKACYIKPLVQKNTCLPDCKVAMSQLKRMFLSSSDDETHEENSSNFNRSASNAGLQTDRSTSGDSATSSEGAAGLPQTQYGSVQYSVSNVQRKRAHIV